MLRQTKLFLLLSLLCSSICAAAQLPQNEGDRQRYDVQIDIRGGYISGLCAMLKDEGIIKASIVNEFGVSAVSFTYNPQKDKVKIVSAIAQLDKWYIRRVLRKDLRNVVHLLQNGDVATYENVKYNIRYDFRRTAASETP